MQKECKVKDLKLSEYGIRPNDFPRILQNARDTMGGLFTLDPHPITDDEILNIAIALLYIIFLLSHILYIQNSSYIDNIR